MPKLIVAEKPSVAVRIATSLSEAQPRRGNLGGVGYFEFMKDGDTVYVVAAAGHLFMLRQKSGGRELPVFDVEWVESYKENKNAAFTKKYLDAIKEVGKKCNTFINACDYDIEGTVIGTNIIKDIVNGTANSALQGQKVMRMRFSTTTRSDLLAAYAKLDTFDKNNFDAGEARHTLDWMWGINFSRALMRAVMISGQRRIVSIGRVQGPTLAILAKREKEIKEFISKPFWKLFIDANEVTFENVKGSMFEKPTAEAALEKSKKGNVTVKAVDVREITVSPYPPFDLTSLQLEANRTLRMDPSKTLATAQLLYEKALISYPRTSSQKLPPTLNLPKIINELSKNDTYMDLADRLIKGSRFKPVEGHKVDEAHPAIYPTGERPGTITDDEARLYDLIVRKFLSVFAENAVKESTKVTLDAGGELYTASGMVMKSPGWTEFYGQYYRKDEMEMPKLRVGEVVDAKKIYMKELKTEPPKRFTKASLIALLEKKDLGTKATRTEVIDTLFRREYIKDTSIAVTDFGMSVYDALSKYSGEIVDEELTKTLDTDMEDIIAGKKTEGEVIDEGKGIIRRIMTVFKKNEKEIGVALNMGIKSDAQAQVLGKCLKDGGNLVIKRSKKGNLFVGCANWPACNNAYPLPHNAKIVPTGKVCEQCHTPKVKVFRKGKRPFEMDLDPNCPTKKDWGKASEGEGHVVAVKASELPRQAAAPAAPIAVAAMPKPKKPKVVKETGVAKIKAKRKAPAKKKKE